MWLYVHYVRPVVIIPPLGTTNGRHFSGLLRFPCGQLYRFNFVYLYDRGFL